MGANSYNLSELSASFFSLIVQLRSSQDFGNPENLRNRITAMFAEMESSGKELGVSSEDLQYAKYALTAFIDEMILNSSWPGKDGWLTRPLQLDYFGVHMAGEEFFKKLEDLRQSADSRIEALETFYTCMQLGYEGKYKILGIEKLKVLMEETGKDISRIRGRKSQELSGKWERPQGLVQGISQEFPIWVWLVVCVAVVFVIFTGLAFWIGYDAGSVAEELTQLLEKQAL